MEIRLLTREEADYRTFSIIHFYHYGVISSDVGLDFIEERIFLEKKIFFPPLEIPFLSVRLTRLGHNMCKNWARISGINLKNLQQLEDIYEADASGYMGKILMSHRRLKSEFTAGKSKKLLKHYDFDITME